ncbi:MAG TPA: PKD domain-containing protein, partial [Actinomycetota bacterium]|nr:PKD domain-containing protein [Actinomycetota bacterium]
MAAIVVLQFLGGPDQARAKQFATLDVLEGTVDVSQGGGAFSEGRDGQSLGEGDVVRTGPQGRAEIEYFDGSMTRLDWSTTFTLEELATLDNAARSKRIVGAQGAGGKTWSRVSRLTDSQSRFEVRTPTATGAVRGTIFATQCEADGTCLYVVIDGSVVVSSAKGSASLHAFDVVEVQPDGTLGEVEHLSLEELLDLFPWIALNGCVLDNVLVCSVGENPPPGEEGGGEPPAGPDTGVPTEGDTGTTGDTGIGPESEPPANNVPNAAFDASETSGPAPLEVAFTSRASDRDGDALAHHWSFGDGETSDAPTPTHTFGPGVHAVTLTVTDPDGASDSASLLISASPPGAPVIGEHPPAETTERSATFTFGGSGAAAAGLGLSVAALAPALGFECSLNGAPFVPCQSPVTYDDLLPGGHAFSVR